VSHSVWADGARKLTEARRAKVLFWRPAAVTAALTAERLARASHEPSARLSLLSTGPQTGFEDVWPDHSSEAGFAGMAVLGFAEL